MLVAFKYSVDVRGTLVVSEEDIAGASEAYQEILNKAREGEKLSGNEHLALTSSSPMEYVIRCLQAGIAEELTEELTSDDSMSLQRMAVKVVLDK